ncbi:type I-E CRISPR-associated protein Cas5/CasD [Streptomyces sp. NPDC058279]|uniref:type I-E CRISPR-associated protein Cas5/CasD n=1 Tax=Streptomyces sp. NPDC058279 TaxID=3346418 RepID=UPI0036E2083D
MTGLLLRLAGPLQSWGERSAFTPMRDTAGFPTRSGLIGMFAAAQGLARGASLNQYDALEITVRIDRPGVLLTDYHTVGGGMPTHLTAATSGGKNKGAAVITRRQYLADAVFVAAVEGPGEQLGELADALRHPHWAPYLGRRSCPPDEPFLLRSDVNDPVAELLTSVPLSRPHTDERRGPTPTPHPDHISVDVLWEHPPSGTSTPAIPLTVQDRPLTFAQHGRSHGKRRLYRTTEQLPAGLLHPEERTLHERLVDYAAQDTTAGAPYPQSTEHTA